jgi:hypothetical protein
MDLDRDHGFSPVFDSLAVHDARGRVIASPAEGVFPVGEQVVLWDGTVRNNIAMASGIYFVAWRPPTSVKQRGWFC